jgi:type IV secretion system protein VirB10
LSAAGSRHGGYAGFRTKSINIGTGYSKAGLLSTLLGVGAEFGPGARQGDSAVLQALRRGAGDSLNHTGQQVVRRNLNMQTDPDHPAGVSQVRVIVNRDLVLEPYT